MSVSPNLRVSIGTGVSRGLGVSYSTGVVDQGSGFTGPLDGLSVAAAFAISAQSKPTKDETGNAVHLRRASDSATDDFVWLSSGLIDTGSINTFLSATSGFAVTAYTAVGSADATQSTAANQPSWNASGLNGGAAFDFDGAAHFFNVASLGVTMGGLLCVFHNDAIINASYDPDHLLHSDANNWVGFGNATSSLTNEIVSIATGGTNRVGWTSASDSIAVGVHSLAIRWTGSTYQIRVDGVERANATNGTPAKMTLSTLVVGSHSGTSRFFDGKISDMFVFGNNPTVADCQSFEAWAAANRGVTLS